MKRKATFKTSVSIRKDLYQRAEARAKELGFENSFSAYVSKLITDDTERKQAA